VILGKLPVLQYVVTRVRKDWHLIEREDGTALKLMREQYAVAMAEENYRLRLFVNDTLFRMRESGRLEGLRRKWHDEFYAYPRRAAAEGLPFSVKELPQHYDQGTCRWMTSR
jgi:ABC-type amino acid transport substrate-binding protein